MMILILVRVGIVTSWMISVIPRVEDILIIILIAGDILIQTTLPVIMSSVESHLSYLIITIVINGQLTTSHSSRQTCRMARHHNIYCNRLGRYHHLISISTLNLCLHLLTVTITITIIITLILLNQYKVFQRRLISMVLGSLMVLTVMAITMV